MLSTSALVDHAATALSMGQRIIKARDAQGYTAAQLARRLGVKTDTLSAWEADRAEPRTNRIIALAGLLSVSPTWLLSGLGNGPNSVNGEAEVEAVRTVVTRLRNLHGEIGEEITRLSQRLDMLDR